MSSSDKKDANKERYRQDRWLRDSLVYGGGFVTLAAAFAIGYQMAFTASTDRVSVSLYPTGNSRNLASTNEGEKEIVSINYDQFKDPQSVFNKAKVLEGESKEGEVSFLIGNILFQDSQGNKDPICQSLPLLELVFEADGLMVEGHPVIMKMKTPCKTYSEHHFIGPFHIPSHLILNSPVQTKEIEYKGSSFQFSNVFFKWPKDWLLVNAVFKNEDSGESFKADKTFSKETTAPPFILSL